MTGLTREAGWEVGVRRTFGVGLDELWDLLTTQPWLARWSGLGELAADRVEGSLQVRR